MNAAARVPEPGAPSPGGAQVSAGDSSVPVTATAPMPRPARVARAAHGPHRVALAVATEQFAPTTALDATASGADLLSQGIVDSIWLDEHAAQGEAE